MTPATEIWIFRYFDLTKRDGAEKFKVGEYLCRKARKVSATGRGGCDGAHATREPLPCLSENKALNEAKLPERLMMGKSVAKILTLSQLRRHDVRKYKCLIQQTVTFKNRPVDIC